MMDVEIYIGKYGDEEGERYGVHGHGVGGKYG